jgi:D-amino-acid dehydrogenase
MTDTADTIVIGAGMVGISCALHLQAQGRAVILCDAREPGSQASHGNAGVVARSSILPVPAPGMRKKLLRYALNRDAAVRVDYRHLPAVLPWLWRFVARSNLRDYRAAAAALSPFAARAWDEHMRLAQRTGAGELYQRRGWLRAHRTQAAFEGFALDRSLLAEAGVEMQELDQAAIRDLEPALRPVFVRGILFPETGNAAPPGEVCRRFFTTFAAEGGRFVSGEAVDVTSDGDRHAVALASGQTLRATHVVVAVGAWARGGLVRRLGYRLPMACERGYHMEYAMDGAVMPQRPIHDAERSYVMAPMRGGVRITSGSELAALDAPPRPVQLQQVLPAVREVVTLGAPLLAQPWMGSRPATPDGMPVIGPAPRHRNLWFAFGHNHIGFSTGPITGRIVADLVAGAPPPFDIAPFSPTRFVG